MGRRRDNVIGSLILWAYVYQNNVMVTVWRRDGPKDLYPAQYPAGENDKTLNGFPRMGIEARGLSGNSSCRLQDEPDSDTSMTEHLDKAVNAEAINLAAHEITDAGLGHAQQLCGCCLGEAAVLDDLGQPDHKVRPSPQVLGLLRRKSEVPVQVLGRRSYFDCHLPLLAFRAEHPELRKSSPGQVDIATGSLPFALGTGDSRSCGYLNTKSRA